MKRLPRVLILLALTIAATQSASAKIYNSLVMKDGSIVRGYTISQRPGKDFVFMSEEATICVNSSLIGEVSREEVNIDDLTPAWRDWAEQNPAFIRQRDSHDYLVMSRISFGYRYGEDSSGTDDEGDVVLTSIDDNPAALPTNIGDFAFMRSANHQVMILEQGDIYKFVDLTHTTYTFRPSDIVKIENEPREANATSGLETVIETRSGESVRGQIVSQQLGKTVQVLQDDGIVRSIAVNNIKRKLKEKINAEQPITAQVPLLDVIKTTTRMYTGVITEQFYGTANEPAYLVITDADGKTQKVANSTIRELRYQPNDAYSTYTKPDIQDDTDVFFNRELIGSTPAERDKKENIIVYQTSIEEMVTLTVADGVLVIEQKDTPENRNSVLVRMEQSRKGKKVFYVFDLAYADDATVTPVSTKTIKGVLRQEYRVETGFYALYHEDSGLVNFCEIEIPSDE